MKYSYEVRHHRAFNVVRKIGQLSLGLTLGAAATLNMLATGANKEIDDALRGLTPAIAAAQKNGILFESDDPTRASSINIRTENGVVTANFKDLNHNHRPDIGEITSVATQLGPLVAATDGKYYGKEGSTSLTASAVDNYANAKRVFINSPSDSVNLWSPSLENVLNLQKRAKELADITEKQVDNILG